MRLLPFRSILESVQATPGQKNLTGQITDFDTLMQPATLEKLEEKHPGAFAFLAFHPDADKQVAEYVRSGSLPDDSGPLVLVLFTVDEETTWGGKEQVAEIPGIKFDGTEHPAYQMVRSLFEGKTAPSLPGIILFDSFAKGSSVFYISLEGMTQDAVRSLLRSVFETAAHIWKSDALHFPNAFAVALTQQRITYVRSDNASPREWLAKTWQSVWEHKGEIVTFLTSVAKHTGVG